MSTPLWPVPSSTAFWGFRGIGWGVTRMPSFDTTRQRTKGGRAAHIANLAHSLDRIKLNWWARDDMAAAANATRTFPTNEARLLFGFFRARRGAFDPFFWTDPTDKKTIDETLALSSPAVGADLTNPDSRNYQVVRTTGGVTEPVGGVNLGVDGETAPVVKVATVSVSFTSNSPKDGWIRLAAVPGTGSLITFTGSYYQRVTFDEDSAEFEAFAFNFWTLKQILLRHKPS